MGIPRRIAYTPGEPAGIGVELPLLLPPDDDCELVVIADPELLRQRAALLGRALELVEFDPARPPAPFSPERLCVLPIPAAVEVEPGRLDPRNAEYVLETLRRAVGLCQDGICHALVTGPVHKGVINQAGVAFTGHTEFLAALCGDVQPVMMLATEEMRVALATTHLPLAQVPAAITSDLLRRVVTTLYRDLQLRFGLERPRVLVAGLNPHAGEGGHLGREEIDVIDPLLCELRAEGMDLRGSLPADTLFAEHLLRDADAVLAMYHDQGLPVLKHRGFGRAVNVTLGLPIIRTSVDHGTALTLAGTGSAGVGSLRYALHTALSMR